MTDTRRAWIRVPDEDIRKTDKGTWVQLPPVDELIVMLAMAKAEPGKAVVRKGDDE